MYDGSNPVPLQMLLLKEEEEVKEEKEEKEEEEGVEKLRTPRPDSGNSKELSLLHNSPARSEVEIFMN